VQFKNSFQVIFFVSMAWIGLFSNNCIAVESVKEAEAAKEVKATEEATNNKMSDDDVIDVEDIIDVSDVDLGKKSTKEKRTINKIIELPNGSLYSGDVKYDVIRDGKGVNEWPNGDRYKGEWLNDSPHGKGLMLKKNKDKYQGRFEFGLYSGLGDLTMASGGRYIGSFRYNQLYGLGLFVSENKEYYLGEFYQHKRHGRFLYFQKLSSKPEYQIWFNDHLEKVIEIDETQDIRDIQDKQLIEQMIQSFTKIGNKRLSQRRANTHYQVRGRVRRIVSDVEDSPEHAYGDLIINLLNLGR